MNHLTDPDNLWGIDRPTLLLDPQRARRNIAAMARKAEQAHIQFRPHFKTHQAADIGEWFRECGVTAITVSSLSMAEHFVRSGWQDITVAFLVNPLEMARINDLAARIRLDLLVDSEAAVARLASGLNHRVRVWIKLDTGYGRTGVVGEDRAILAALARSIIACAQLELAGLLTHSGQSYQAQSSSDIRHIHQLSVSRLLSAKEVVTSITGTACAISIGDTPTCCLVDEWSGVDEIRPGNFVFYDVMQLLLGTCRAEDIAVAVACPVVGKYEQRGQIVLYGGSVHLSKESICAQDGSRIYGYLTRPAPETLGQIILDAPVVSLTQEHGVVAVPADRMQKIQIGDVAYVLPAHSCLTAALYRCYVCLDGDKLTRMF